MQGMRPLSGKVPETGDKAAFKTRKDEVQVIESAAKKKGNEEDVQTDLKKPLLTERILISRCE